jgi:6-pyruvoyl-tetrahydropterin synthase
VVVVDVDVTGFLDFKVLDALLWQVLQPMDHAMILQKEDPLLIVLEDMGFRTYSTNEEPTTEYLAEVIGSELVHHHLLSVTKVTVHETDKYSATWRNPNAFPRR